MVHVNIVTKTYHGLTGHVIGNEFLIELTNGRTIYETLGGYDTLQGALNDVDPKRILDILPSSAREAAEDIGVEIGGVFYSPAELGGEYESEQ